MRPRPAAATVLVRDAASAGPGIEVLLLKRSADARFMPGAFVFPGGALDAADAATPCDETTEQLGRRIGAVVDVGDRARAFACAALRECEEECGLVPGAGSASAGVRTTSVLRPWSRWVTPLGLPRRFDTVFFLAPAPRGQVLRIDGREVTEGRWARPADALADAREGRILLALATTRQLQSLTGFARVDDLLREAAGLRCIPTVHPKLRLDSAGAILATVAPDEPGYADLVSYWDVAA